MNIKKALTKLRYEQELERLQMFDIETDPKRRRPVSAGALAFHELAEAAEKGECGLRYGAAQVEAGRRELLLLKQRLGVTDGRAGATLAR